MSGAIETWAVRFPVPAAAAGDVAGALMDCLDPRSAAVSAFESAPGQWMVEAYFASPPEPAEIAALIAAAAGDDAAQAMRIRPVAARDWTAASLAGLTPVVAGRFVVHGAHHRGRLPPHRIAIEIEAALAFGTGHHGTTRGCLLALDRILKARRPRRMLDVGTGTGVLAIAAAKAVRRRVLASDIDPTAARVARANVRANGAAAFVDVVCATGATGPAFRRRAPFDLILANIVLGPLQRLARRLGRLVRPGGRIVLSGLLASQANAALAAYRMQSLYLERRADLDGWSTLCLRHSGGRRPAAKKSARAEVEPGPIAAEGASSQRTKGRTPTSLRPTR